MAQHHLRPIQRTLHTTNPYTNTHTHTHTHAHTHTHTCTCTSTYHLPLINQSTNNLGGITSSPLFMIARINQPKSCACALIPKKSPKLPCTQKKERKRGFVCLFGLFPKEVATLCCVVLSVILKRIYGRVLRFPLTFVLLTFFILFYSHSLLI